MMTREQLQQIRAIVYDAYCEGDTEAEWMLVVIDAELAKPEQEPVASISVTQLSAMAQSLDVDKNQTGYHWRKGWNDALRQAMDYARTYTTPVPAPQREWQSLTPDEINNCASAEIYPSTWAMAFARAIESKLKEKNHG